VGQATRAFFEMQVDGHGNAAHVRDLQIEDDEIGLVGLDCLAHLLAASHRNDLVVGTDERGAYEITYPRGVGGDEIAVGGHPRRLPGVRRGS
jgi:hypothetical protein